MAANIVTRDNAELDCEFDFSQQRVPHSTPGKSPKTSRERGATRMDRMALFFT
jgi:hypothetical protein